MFGLRNKLEYKIVFGIITSAFFAFFIYSIISAIRQYSLEMDVIKKELKNFESINIESIAHNMWQFDLETTALILKGGLNAPHIQWIRIMKDGHAILEVGNKDIHQTIKKEFKINFVHNGKLLTLGTVELFAETDRIYKDIFKNLYPSILGFLFLMVFLSAMLISMIRSLILSHISILAQHLLDLNENTIGKQIALKKKSSSDELDIICSAINSLSTSLREAIDAHSKSLKEKDILLKEVHHRVKNNIAIISSLLHLQTPYIADKATLEMFAETQSRIQSMALVHEKLYKSNDFSHVNVKEFIYDLSYEIKAAFDKNYISKLIFDCEDIIISMELLVPLGLLINEILTNAYKHAICDNAPLNISISLASVPERKQRLSISDDGIGLPDGFNISQSEGLGLKLVKGLVSQIDGTLEIRSKPTTFSITFPEDVKHARRTKNNTDDYFT